MQTTVMGIQFIDTTVEDDNNNNNNTTKESNCNLCVGVLLPVNDTELQQFDYREVGYHRYEIPVHDIVPIPHLLDDDDNHNVYADTFLQQDSTPTRTTWEPTYEDQNDDEESLSSSWSTSSIPHVWVYVPQHPQPASLHYPIAQSYLDILLRGALSISIPFCHAVLQSTTGWWGPYEKEFSDKKLNTTTTKQRSSSSGTMATTALSTTTTDKDEEEDDDDDDGTSTTNRSWATTPSMTHSSSSTTSTLEEDEQDDEDIRSTNNTTTTTTKYDDDDSYDDYWWVNDRTNPFYVRADVQYSVQHAQYLDELLQQHIPSFRHLRHDGGSDSDTQKRGTRSPNQPITTQ
jgi:hypothetical protein